MRMGQKAPGRDIFVVLPLDPLMGSINCGLAVDASKFGSLGSLG